MQPDKIAKKIRENLLSQKEKLKEYLKLLDCQEGDIKEENADKLLSHIEIEKKIIDELMEFKKVLIPLEDFYYNPAYKKDDTIIKLKESINNLSGSVKEKANINKLELETIIKRVALKVSKFNKQKINKSPYITAQPSIVDISG